MLATNRFRLTITKPFIFFSVIMLLKSYLAWMVIFDDVTPWRPLITEIPFIWLVFSLIEWFASKRKMAAYMTVNLLLTAIFFAAIMYYKYYGVIVNYHALEQVNQVTAVSNSVFSLMDPYYLLIFTDIIVLFVLLFRSDRIKNWKKKHSKKEKRALASSVFVVSLMLCLVQIMPNRAIMNEIVRAQEMGILNYEAYTIFQNEDTELADAKSIHQEEINTIKGLSQVKSPAYQGISKGKNVIIIQMESFQNFLIDLKLDGKEATPVMNKLAHDSIYLPNFFQNVGQGNTSDAEFVVNTSFYIPPRGAATQHYADKQLPSLAKLLKKDGYQSATFHTNIVEFWNRRELYEGLGFDHYYDKSFFGEPDKVFFGSSDEVLYTKTAEQLKKMSDSGDPFYAQVLSMSAHHPYTIPESKYKMTLPERYEETFVGDYIRSQNYADYALGQFIDQLKKDGIWDNSLVIVYGDHQGLPIYSLDNDDKELMKEIYGREYVSADMINIPLIIHGEGYIQPEVMKHIGGQVDILPTVANLTGISMKDQLHFGQDLLNQKDYNLLPERYYLPSGTFINNTTLFIPGNAFEDGSQYPLPDNTEGETQASKEEFDRALELLHLSDSYLRQLPEHNK